MDLAAFVEDSFQKFYYQNVAFTTEKNYETVWAPKTTYCCHLLDQKFCLMLFK